MEVETLKIVGQVAGIGGLALGVFLLLFRDLIRRNIFPMLPANEAYRLLRLITIAVWSTAVIGIGAWVYTTTRPAGASTKSATNCSIVVGGGVSNSNITNSGDCDDKK